MAFTHPSCPSPVCPSPYPYLKKRTNQSRDPKGCTYQSSDLERCTYQSSDPDGCTYQSSDLEGCTYQPRDPEGYTYQSRNPKGHRACKPTCTRRLFSLLHSTTTERGTYDGESEHFKLVLLGCVGWRTEEKELGKGGDWTEEERAIEGRDGQQSTGRVRKRGGSEMGRL
ncbi:NBS-LRR type resistance protein [Cucumis melo var. makuwa]|uniref:NBS-LRR type resistance protein n=1 Tax=Cucumis melo var. makuwa TaxID=1194695 RepID=A0A5D3DWA2_CUCMM|nr:NBS-LRR type resistance protein [Cucumis melo var. makuwa]